MEDLVSIVHAVRSLVVRCRILLYLSGQRRECEVILRRTTGAIRAVRRPTAEDHCQRPASHHQISKQAEQSSELGHLHIAAGGSIIYSNQSPFEKSTARSPRCQTPTVTGAFAQRSPAVSSWRGSTGEEIVFHLDSPDQGYISWLHLGVAS